MEELNINLESAIESSTQISNQLVLLEENNSFGYSFLNKSIDVLELMVSNIYLMLSQALDYLLFTLVLTSIVIFGVRVSFKQAPNLLQILSLLSVTVFISHVMLKTDVFIELIYKPIIITLFLLLNKSIEVSGIIENGGLEQIFQYLDQITGKIMLIGQKISDGSSLTFQLDSYISGKLLQVLSFCFYALAIFMVFYSFLGIHILFALLPIMVIFSIFINTRFLLINNILGILKFFILAFSIVITICVSIYFFNGILESVILNEELPNAVYIQLLVISFISIAMSLKAGIIASSLVKR
jgi:hypothetical protein